MSRPIRENDVMSSSSARQSGLQSQINFGEEYHQSVAPSDLDLDSIHFRSFFLYYYYLFTLIQGLKQAVRQEEATFSVDRKEGHSGKAQSCHV